MKVNELKKQAVDLYVARQNWSNKSEDSWGVFHRACEEYKAYSNRYMLQHDDVRFVFLCLDLHHTYETYNHSVGTSSCGWKKELDAFDSYVKDKLLPKTKKQLLDEATEHMDALFSSSYVSFTLKDSWNKVKLALENYYNE